MTAVQTSKLVPFIPELPVYDRPAPADVVARWDIETGECDGSEARPYLAWWM